MGWIKVGQKDRLPRILKTQDKFKDSLAPEELAHELFSRRNPLEKMVCKEEKAQMKSDSREDLICFVHETGMKTNQRN